MGATLEPLEPFSLLAIVFGGAAIVSIGVVPFVLGRERRLARDGTTTTGTVVAIEADQDTGYHAVVEFMTPHGQRTLFESTRRNGRQVGATVSVRYLPDRPEEARIDTRAGIYGRTIMAVALCIGFSIAASVMLVLRHHLGGK